MFDCRLIYHIYFVDDVKGSETSLHNCVHVRIYIYIYSNM
jgi:hypothetical protein